MKVDSKYFHSNLTSNDIERIVSHMRVRKPTNSGGDCLGAGVNGLAAGLRTSGD